MDPLLFGIHGDQILEVLAMVVLLSMVIERALAPVFEWRPVIVKIRNKGIKEPIAYLLSLCVVYFYKFDLLAILFKEESSSWFGYFVTAAVIAGGSKGSVKLFRDWLGIKSVAQKQKELLDEADTRKKLDGVEGPVTENR